MSAVLPETPGCDPPPELVGKRVVHGSTVTPRPSDLPPAVTLVDLGGVSCVRFPGGAECILYLHGGGFRMGSPYIIHTYLTGLAAVSECDVLAVRYRLAPEHPFPAALNDCLTAWTALDHGRTRYHLAGDSAGGNLAAATFLAARRSGLPDPASIMLFSPWLDLTMSAPSFRECAATDQRFSLELAQEAAAMYLAGHNPHDELASPLFGGWDGDTPPLLLHASSDEVLRDDARSLHARATGVGGRVWSEEFKDEPHVWHYAYPKTSGSRAAIAHVRTFLGGVHDLPGHGS